MSRHVHCGDSLLLTLTELEPFGLSKRLIQNVKWYSKALWFSHIKTKLCVEADLESRTLNHPTTNSNGWSTVLLVERRSLTGELSLSCARPAADRWPLMWVNRPLYISQPGRISLSSFRGRQMSSILQLDMRNVSLGRRHLVNAYVVKAGIGVMCRWNFVIHTPWECEELQKVRYIKTYLFKRLTLR